MIPRIPTTDAEYQSFLAARAEYLVKLIQSPIEWARDHRTFAAQRETYRRFTNWEYFKDCVRWELFRRTL